VPDWRCVVTPNVDHLVRYRKHPSERATADHAWMVLPDGMPIVWASRLLGRPLTGRLTGADLFAAMWPRVVERQAPAVVVASSDVVADRLGAEHVGCIVPPMFAVDDEPTVDRLLDEIEQRLDQLEAQFLVVGVSMPKHHLIANRLRDRWQGEDRPRPVVLLLGASPDFALGLTPRAPEWMQRTGLEWVHRLVLDPRRMAKRYLVDDVAFVGLVWREWRNTRSASPITE
jgi:N-acetylglucosaminyldiphosphoundecaprenol N-acetyl-beta-D-mannosaminyltransferase